MTMTNLTSIARPYAKAAFETAKSSNEIATWSIALKQLSHTVKEKSLRLVLNNPNYTKKQLADLLIAVLHQTAGNGAEKSFQKMENFVRLLSEKKRLTLLPAISVLFDMDSAQEHGFLFLEVATAFALSEEQKIKTKAKLEKQFHSKCEIDYKVHPELVGGMLVRSPNWVWDNSIKGNLERLKNTLI